MTSPRFDYDKILATARKYATGFRDFSLPDATYAIAGHMNVSYGLHAGGLFRRYVKRAMDRLVAEGVLAVYPRCTELPDGTTSLYREYRTIARETVRDPEPWDDEHGSVQARSERMAATFRDWFGLPAIAQPSLGIDGARAGVWLDGPTAERVLERLREQETASS